MALGISIAAAFALTVLVWRVWRRDRWQPFGRWWNAEGIGICILLTILVLALGTRFGLWL